MVLNEIKLVLFNALAAPLMHWGKINGTIVKFGNNAQEGQGIITAAT
jgi:hypothetical protein